MSNLALLIVLAVCALAVLAGLGYFGLRGYRLAKAGMRAAASVKSASEQLAESAAQASARAQQLGEKGTLLASQSEKLRAAFARLGVLIEALQRAVLPWQRLRAPFTK